MCGIVGIVNRRGLLNDILSGMLAQVAHRGPDDHGLWISSDRRVGLGHARLSIIDLSSAGHQPMTNTNGDLVVSFNGEIYNFLAIRDELERDGSVFHSRSDTEVILRAYEKWGESAISRFNGMFALAIYDDRKRKLLIARDRAGEKPLYYHHSSETFAFASEAKAILQAADGDWPLDPESVHAYFAFGYIPGNRSIFKNVRRLPPGCVLTYDVEKNTAVIEPYWTLNAVLASRRPEEDFEALSAELERLLDDSVQLRMIADVPLGILLSGGVDSSMVTALATRHTRRVNTFTVTFPGAGAHNEQQHARVVSEFFGTDHHELALPAADLHVFQRVAEHLDEPLGDPSVIPTYQISELTRRHVKVALGGDGGDELFGGYPWYREALSAEQSLSRIPRVIRRTAAKMAARIPPGVHGRNFVLAHGGDLPHYFVSSRTSFDPRLRSQLLAPMIARFGSDSMAFPESANREMWPRDGDSFTKMSILDLRSFLPDDILVKVDRASMAFALEMRAPFLDHRVIEFALQKVPSHLKATTAGSRFLQRELARRILPRNLDLVRKQGFVMPIHQWFAGSWGQEFESVIRASELTEWIDRRVAMDLLRGHRRGRTNGLRLFMITMFALWLSSLRQMRRHVSSAA